MKSIQQTERASYTETKINLQPEILSVVTFLNTKNRFVSNGGMIWRKSDAYDEN